MHVHVSAMSAILTFLSVIVIGFLWRFASMRLADTRLGQAMAFVY